MRWGVDRLERLRRCFHAKRACFRRRQLTGGCAVCPAGSVRVWPSPFRRLKRLFPACAPALWPPCLPAAGESVRLCRVAWRGTGPGSGARRDFGAAYMRHGASIANIRHATRSLLAIGSQLSLYCVESNNADAVRPGAAIVIFDTRLGGQMVIFENDGTRGLLYSGPRCTCTDHGPGPFEPLSGHI